MPTSASSAWPHWFQFAGVRSAPPAPRLMFTFVDQSVQAAVRGQGVVLARTPFVDELVASGDLIAPFPKLRMPTGYQYALIANVNTARRRTSRRSATGSAPNSSMGRCDRHTDVQRCLRDGRAATTFSRQ